MTLQCPTEINLKSLRTYCIAVREIYGVSVKLNNKITSGLVKTTSIDAWSYDIILELTFSKALTSYLCCL